MNNGKKKIRCAYPDVTRCTLHDSRQGFTLVETLVAASIFVALTTIAVGAFVQALKSQRYLTSIMALENNVGSAIEQMARELRTGYGFCPQNDPDAPEACVVDNLLFVDFVNYAGIPTRFGWNTDGAGRGYIMRNEYPITAGGVDVTDASFSVREDGPPGFPPSPCAPWRITISLKARSTNPDLSARPITIQTTVSSRVLPWEAPNASSRMKNVCPQVGG